MMRNSYKFLLVFIFAMLSCVAIAQAPQQIRYQAVVRYPNNALVANSVVSVRISILHADGTVAYCETHSPTTTPNGLFNINIGTGTVESGSMEGIDWSRGNYLMRSEVDYDGGTNYRLATEGQMISVPYSFYANRAKQADFIPGLTDSLHAIGLRDSLAVENLRRELTTAVNSFDWQFVTVNARLATISSNQQNAVDGLASELRREDSLSADSLYRYIMSLNQQVDRDILTLNSRIGTLQSANSTIIGDLAKILRREDSASADTLNRSIIAHNIQVNRDLLVLNSQLNSLRASNTEYMNGIVAALRQEDSVSADSLNRSIIAHTNQVNRDLLVLNSQLNSLRASNTDYVNGIVAALRQEDSVSADSLNRSIIALNNQVNRDLLVLNSQLNSLRASNTEYVNGIVAALRQEDSVSADSLNRAIIASRTQMDREILTLNGQLNAMRVSNAEYADDLAAALRREDSVSADSLYDAISDNAASIAYQGSLIRNLQGDVSNVEISISALRMRLLANISSSADMLRAEDSASADTLNRKIVANAANIANIYTRVNSLDNRIENINNFSNTRIDSIALVMHHADVRSADSLNTKIGNNAADITVLRSQIRNLGNSSTNRMDSIAAALHHENRVTNDSIAAALRHEDVRSADSLNTKIGNNAADITVLRTRINNYQSAGNNRMDSIAAVLHHADVRSADSLNTRIGNNAADITVLRTRINNYQRAGTNRMDSIAAALHHENSVTNDSIAAALRHEDVRSADSLNTKIGNNAADITVLRSQIRNLGNSSTNRMDSIAAALHHENRVTNDSIATVLRQEDATSADSLNRKIGTNAANITALDTRISNLRTNENNRMDSLATVLRQEDAVSADSLNRKFGNYLLAADETKTLAQVLVQGNDADNHSINNLAKGQALTDAANLQNISDTATALRTEIDTRIANRSAHNLSDVLAAGNNGGARQIKNIADPTENQDAATLKVLRDSIDTLRHYINRMVRQLEYTMRCATLSTTSSVDVMSCDSLVWTVGGENAGTYRVSGTYIHRFSGVNAAGCDSTIVMNLIVNNSSSSVDRIVAPSGYVWIDGVTYNDDNNTAVHTLVNGNTNGCDSVVRLRYTALDGAVPAVITVSSDNKKIVFAKGNLQYQASTRTWRFAENQWVYIGQNLANKQPSETQSLWMDLFGWGTSGWDNGTTGNVYQPWSSAGKDSTYNNGAISLTGEYAHADWGVHNPISNGGNQAGLWRTLTSAEWKYLLTERSASTVNGVPNARFTHAKVNGGEGLIIFADNYVHPDGVAQPRGIDTLANSPGYTYYNNNYTLSEWQAMERAGAIFLPATGYRRENSTNYTANDGRYWASTYAECNPSSYAETVATTNNNTNAGGERFSWLAGYLYFGHGDGVQFVDRRRSRGASVRLIHDVD